MNTDDDIARLRARLQANKAASLRDKAQAFPGVKWHGDGTSDYRQAAVLVAITEYRGELALLLTRRAAHLDLHPGEAAFPGGKKDADDITLLHTALREAREEVSLNTEQFDYLGVLDQHLTRSNIEVSPFIGLIPGDVELTPNLDELDCIYKVPLSYFSKIENMKIERMKYQGQWRNVPRFDVSTTECGDHSIWGVTALIIVDLMNTVFDANLKLPLCK